MLDGNMARVTKKALWAVQLQEYPDSIRISNREIFWWVNDAPREKRDYMMYLLALHMTQNPHGVFYRTSAAPDAFVGFRFGLEGWDYSSNWTRYNYV
jgi:hypothetical protein